MPSNGKCSYHSLKFNLVVVPILMVIGRTCQKLVAPGLIPEYETVKQYRWLQWYLTFETFVYIATRNIPSYSHVDVIKEIDLLCYKLLYVLSLAA